MLFVVDAHPCCVIGQRNADEGLPSADARVDIGCRLTVRGEHQAPEHPHPTGPAVGVVGDDRALVGVVGGPILDPPIEPVLHPRSGVEHIRCEVERTLVGFLLRHDQMKPILS